MTEHYTSLLEDMKILDALEAEKKKASFLKKYSLQKKIQSLRGALHGDIAKLISVRLDEIGAKALRADVKKHFKSHKILQDFVLKRLAKEAKKSPFRRKIERYFWKGFLVVLAVFALIFRQYNLITVDAPLETKEGIMQRAAAYDKFSTYNSLVAGSRNGFAKMILFWPIEPTKEEVNYASEFIFSAGAIYNRLKKAETICDAEFTYDDTKENYDDKDDVMKIATISLHFIQEKFNPEVEADAIDVLAASFFDRFRCLGVE
ncbi:MAG: hypothetical protein JW812_02430 [Alphaproteobacteria bacterium]|nr:hypothetical protein [Alphaproteobacteria bacterium]MBN2780278.1 hypothetical protein [Alphaproteobacteria bacterium]